MSLAASVVTVINADDYGKAIKDCFLRRELIELGEQVVNEAYTHTIELPATQQIELAEGKLFSLAETDNIDGGLQDFNSALIESIKMAEAAYKRDGGLAGVSSGFNEDGMFQLIELDAPENSVAPIIFTIPLQLLAYHAAVLKGTDVDQPRNLAKSVTVE